MTIAQSIHNISTYYPDAYLDLKNIMERAYVTLSFWGVHKVHVVNTNGKHESISFRTLVLKIMKFVESHTEESTNTEREYFWEVSEKIRLKLADQADMAHRAANIITKIFATIYYFIIDSPDMYTDYLDKY